MLVLALPLAAFIQPAAANGTTADDRAVMSAVLDGFLRADRDPSIRPGRHRDEQSDARLLRREPGYRTPPAEWTGVHVGICADRYRV